RKSVARLDRHDFTEPHRHLVTTRYDYARRTSLVRADTRLVPRVPQRGNGVLCREPAVASALTLVVGCALDAGTYFAAAYRDAASRCLMATEETGQTRRRARERNVEGRTAESSQWNNQSSVGAGTTGAAQGSTSGGGRASDRGLGEELRQLVRDRTYEQ